MRPSSVTPASHFIRFQSTHPRRVRLMVVPSSVAVNEFQSTHPRRVRLVRFIPLFRNFSVSIHAPTKGATWHSYPEGRQVQVSIHAPTKGATLYIPSLFQNPVVSIHAPTKGATMSEPIGKVMKLVSIHAPTKGATSTTAPHTRSLVFQSTHPRRVRPGKTSFLRPILCFNPRTHEGCDYECNKLV